MCGKEYRIRSIFLNNKQANGFLLAELLISFTIICIALLALLSLIGTSVKWWQQWQISNEVYLEATTTRLTIANYTKQSPKKMTVGQTGTYLYKMGFGNMVLPVVKLVEF